VTRSICLSLACTLGIAGCVGHNPDGSPAVVKVAPPPAGPVRQGTTSNANSAIAARRGQFATCYRASLARDSNLRVHLVLRIDVGPTGVVRSVLWNEAQGAPDDLLACLENAVRGIQFAPPDAGTAIIVVPFTFKPTAT
jgi:hypothetical protein